LSNVAGDEPRVVMALKVRDEEDVIDSVLRYHRAQGVDFFIVTDNASTDRTPEILGRWIDAGLARVITEPSPELRERGAEWVTRMARLAATEHGADWVVHGDADEFWWPLEGDIKSALAAVPAEFGVVLGPRVEFIARPDGPGTFFDRLVYREARSLLRPKIAHRALADAIVLHRGQHDVAAGADLDDAWQRLRTPGRPVLRTVRPEGPGEVEERLVWYPHWPLRIFHLPLRSFDQYRRKVEAMLNDPVSGGGGMRGRLRERYETGRLDELYAELTEDDEAVERGVAEGRLARDVRLRDFMAAVGDPLGGGASPDRAAPVPGEIAAEEAELELDVMHVLGRTERMLMIRNDEVRARARELEAEVERLRTKRGRAPRRRRPLRRRIRRLVGRLLGRGRAA
jgi:glycosyl transferase family 2